jgi:2,3-dihydroxyphenylpropionate 1,2-dioxygenase
LAKIVLGIGASHTTLMNTAWQKVDHLDRAHRFRDALNEAARRLSEAKPDAVIIVGSNHFRGFWTDMMPAFTVGVGEIVSAGEHGTPAGEVRSHARLAQDICDQFLKRDFDIAFSTRLVVDHGISHAIQWLVQSTDCCIVPIVVNCFAPPLPSLRRSRAFGEALGRILEETSQVGRIAVIGTGGLSHRLPFPDWRAPQSDDDAFLAESFRVGRGRWQEFEPRRRSIVVNAPPRLNEEFDRGLLERLGEGKLRALADECSDQELITAAGNGAAEIRAWLIMAAALGYQKGEVLAYSPMPEWLTGMAVALIANH